MRMRVILACISLYCAGLAQASDFAAARPVPRIEYPQKRLNDITAYLNTASDLSRYHLVFIGDSITDFFTMGANPWLRGKIGGKVIWDETFGDGPPENRALNLGISGDRTEWLLYRLQAKSAGGLGELDDPRLMPEFIPLMAGINNTYGGEEPLVDSVYAGIVALVNEVHALKPSARIVLESLLPSNEDWRNQEAVLPVNQRLYALAQSSPYRQYVDYIDLYPLYVNAEGHQRPELFMDGLHPNEAGYRLWRDALLSRIDHERAVVK